MAILQILNYDILFLITFLCNDYTNFKKEFKTCGLKMTILGIIVLNSGCIMSQKRQKVLEFLVNDTSPHLLNEQNIYLVWHL